jgi:hypothetical protein
MDETLPSKRGYAGPSSSDDDRFLDSIRFLRFVERCGAATVSEVVCHCILGFTRRNAKQLIELLDEQHIRDLKEFASSIPRTREQREARGFTIFSGGSVNHVPDDTLLIIRSLFVEDAG